MALAGECWGLDAILRRGVSGSPISLEKVRWRLIVPSFEMMRQIGRVFQALSRAGDFGCPVQGDGVVRVAARDERGAAETLFRASEVFGGQATKRSTSDHVAPRYVPVGVGCLFRWIRTAGEIALTHAGFKNNRPRRSPPRRWNLNGGRFNLRNSEVFQMT